MKVLMFDFRDSENEYFKNNVFTDFEFKFFSESLTDKTKLSDERLKDLVEHMSKIRVGNNDYAADVMGDAYEYLIKKFADLFKSC